MRKHIFENFQYFLYKKKRLKHVRVLAVCNTQENIFYIYMYICHIASKTGYSTYEIAIFTMQKKHKKKIHMPCPVTVQVN